MGIFGVSMPPIYGEGDVKAFMRLQQEIIKISEDRSIFAWKASAEEKEDRGLFARSPSEFRESGEVGASAEVQIEKIATFAFNNNGIHIHLPLVSTGDADVFRASLDCQSERDGTHISVYLKKVAAKRYVRYHPWELPLRPEVEKGDLQELIVKENSLPRRPKHPSTSAQQCGIKLLPFATSCSVEKSESFWIRFNSQYSAAEEEAACVTYHDIDGTENAVGLLVYPTSDSSNSKNRTFIRSRRNPNQTPRLAFKAISKASYPNMLEEKEEAIPDDWLRNLKADDDRWRGSADRTLTCLENGNGVVALNLHIAAEHSELKPELEAFYFTKSEKIPLPVSTERLVASRKWGWLVSTEIEGLTLERVHPADYFQARHDKQTYISCLDDGDLPASNSRILIYRFNAKGLTDRKAFVAFGFRSLAEPWTDMRVRTISSPKATDDEVEKYERDIEGGNREEYTAIAVHKFAEGVQGDTNTLNVVVGKRENLQLGSHFLRISWSEPCISVDQSD
ncbi:hypothetical protein VKT23_006567 [Stygiomarasmius scandens]|uniref:Uncharacterized protein n=1 Tax=Marasmiellus scandens TaxID=2682957 RepID=A0ABR1JP21_9AGAR